MSEAKRGLGRGLSALIPQGLPPVADPTGGGVSEIAIDDMAPNPHQPRQQMDEGELGELAASIRTHGILQPLIVTRNDGGGPRYHIVAGERRWRAARLAGLTTVPVIVKEANSQAMLEWALIENLQRADLNPLEAAAAYRALMDEFGLTQEAVAQRVGKSRVAVTNALRLLRLPNPLKEALLAGQITEGHARALLALDDADVQATALALVVGKGLNVRQTEALVRQMQLDTRVEDASPTDEAKEKTAPSPEVRALEDSFRRVLGTKVELVRTKRGGRLIIHFYSEEELDNIYRQIVGDEG